MSQAAPNAWLAVCIAAVLFLPGAAALTLVKHPSTGLSRFALMPGASIALVAVAFLWSTTLGVSWTSVSLRLVTALLLLAVFWSVWRSRRTKNIGTKRAWWAAGVAAVVLVATVSTRVTQAEGLVLAPWVDGYHHTLITQLMTLSGGVPSGWDPFLPIEGFYYHFGFHAVAAAVALVAGAEVPGTVLWVGQAINMAAVLSTYALATRLARHRISAVAAAAVPATLFFFPAYYITWGRYTQLAGLVVLPVAWVLLADGTLTADARRVRVLAAAVAAGLMLTHYRVFAFFLIGVLLLAAYCLNDRSLLRARLSRLVGTAAVGGAVGAPWILGALLPGVRSMAATSSDWYRAPDSVNEVPDWLFDVGTVADNRFWIRVGAVGAVVGALRRRVPALALLAFMGCAVVAVGGPRLGLPATYMLPPFSLVIGLYLPCAIGVALLIDEVVDLASVIDTIRGPAEAALAAVIVVLVVAGATRMRTIVNPSTVIAEQADATAAAWIKENTPVDACFVVGATHWHLNTYRGADGGYWLPLLAERPVTMPAAFYNYGDEHLARTILTIAETVGGADAMTGKELLGLMERTGAEYVYSGDTGAELAGWLDPALLRENADLVEIYAADGVHVFQRTSLGAEPPSPSGPSATAESVVCRPVAPVPDPDQQPTLGR